MPGLHFRNDGKLWELSIEYAGETKEGRTRYKYYLDGPGLEISGSDLKSGVGGGTLAQGMATLCNFLSAFAEALSYQERTGRESDNADLFPAEVAEFARLFSDELSMAETEIEENKEALIE